MISTLQLKRGLAHNEPTFMAILVKSVEIEEETILEIIQFVLEKY